MVVELVVVKGRPLGSEAQLSLVRWETPREIA